jgi:cell filamentation protein
MSRISSPFIDISMLRGLAGRAAWFLGEINAAHPFREGNARTQREFIREVGLQAGHYVDWRATTREEMTTASQLSHVSGDWSLFAKVLRVCMRGKP